MPHAIEALLQAADMALMAGQHGDALDLLNEAAALAPDNPLPCERRAELLLSLPGQDNTRLALDDLQRLLALGADTVELRYRMMLALADLGDLAAARAAYAEAARYDDCSLTLCGRIQEWGVRLALRDGDSQAALDILRAMRRQHPDAPGWARQEAELLLHLEDYAAARAAFDALIARHAPDYPVPGQWDAPQWTAIFLQRAECLRRLGEYDAALADIAAAEANMPDDPGVPFARGQVLWACGDSNAAFAHLLAGLRAAGPGVRAGFWASLAGYPAVGELQDAVSGMQG